VNAPSGNWSGDLLHQRERRRQRCHAAGGGRSHPGAPYRLGGDVQSDHGLVRAHRLDQFNDGVFPGVRRNLMQRKVRPAAAALGGNIRIRRAGCDTADETESQRARKHEPVVARLAVARERGPVHSCRAR
jgi:hypothetical protein